MSVGLSNSLVGLSLLTGTDSLAGLASSGGTSAAAPESAAARLARAGFTLPATTPPWKQPAGSAGESQQLAAVKRLATIIDKPATGAEALPADVQTSFTAYKALDRLRLMAAAAAKSTTGSAERTALDAQFAKGLDDLRTYLAQAPSDKLDLAFGVPTRRADTVGVPVRTAFSVQGDGVVAARDAALPGLAGTETFTITLTKPGGGASDSVSVDLSGTPQPPTLDSVAEAFNAAIAAIPLRNPDGTLYTDANGESQPRWLVRFVPDKATDKWGFEISNPALEQLSISQDNAPDAVVVAAGQTALDAPERVRLLRFDESAGGPVQKTLGEIAGCDALGTARARLTAPKASSIKGVTLSSPEVHAPTSAAGLVTAPDGSSYVVGTTAGQLEANHPAGREDLTLTRMDSEGRVLWQRMLGAANDAQGAAISLAPDGGVVVAGTVTGAFDGQTSDGDMLVARYDAVGNESWSSLVRSVGTDQASAIAVAGDGSVYVGGKATGVGGTGAGNALLVRLDGAGHVLDRRTIDAGGSEGVTALGIAPDDSLIALTQESGHAVVRRIDGQALSTDLARIDLGAAQGRALAVAADGAIAVGGTTSAALAGAQDNGLSGGADGFVTRLSSSLASAATRYIGTDGTDGVDSVAFLGGRLYAGGRTTGALAGAKTGATDGFVVALDAASGAALTASQFGRTAEQTGAVRVAAAPGGAGVLGALGLARGVLTPQDSDRLTAQTALRAGDSFSVRLNGGAAKAIVIAADDTMASLATKVRRALGGKAAVTTPTTDGRQALRIEAKSGADVELVAGPQGGDALEKLGLTPQRLVVPTVAGSGRNDPKVLPGGTFGLALDPALSLRTASDAGLALGKIRDALSVSQTAYRSLYWDSAKAKQADAGASGGTVPAYLKAQLASYQDALSRISAITGLT